MLKFLKSAFCRFYWFRCKNTVPSLSPEMTFVPRVELALDCILDSYKDCFIIFMLQKKYGSSGISSDERKNI